MRKQHVSEIYKPPSEQFERFSLVQSSSLTALTRFPAAAGGHSSEKALINPPDTICQAPKLQTTVEIKPEQTGERISDLHC